MHLKLKSNNFFSYHRGIPLSIISILAAAVQKEFSGVLCTLNILNLVTW